MSRRMSELKDQPLHASSSEAVTNNVRVEVESQYAPERSQPFQNHWFFHYTVRITNEGVKSEQLAKALGQHIKPDSLCRLSCYDDTESL